MSSCRFGRVRVGVALVLLIPAASGLARGENPESSRSGAALTGYQQQIKPLLEQFCYDCHGNGKKRADLALDAYPDEAAIRQDRKTWQNVLHQVRTSEMPPRNKPQPSLDDRERIIAWIESEIFPTDCDQPDPGRVTIRRLNRVEYNNTIRDLAGVEVRPADDFPSDDVGYGFDNIGDVLSLPPILLEKYLWAAEKVLDAALGATNRPASDTAPLIMICQPGESEDQRVCARKVIERFASRAFRRPATDEETDRLLSLFDMAAQDGADFQEAVKVALQAVLISPYFLFRGELQPGPDNPAAVHAVSEFVLASRLSYFLWSTMPDDELFADAQRGTLRQNLESQVRRMLGDPKAQALVENFAFQWLQIRSLKAVAPDPAQFPEFDDELRAAMEKETELFCQNLLREDRSVLEFLDADYTFANERLARHYDIPGVDGPQFRRISLQGSARGGILTQGSILTITSNPTRTSPVKRGKWVLDNILGAPPPPAPPDVPELESGPELTGTLRERMIQHRDNPLCSSCHARMDPIGFGFENFNAIGRWRETDGGSAVDASGQLATGESFQGPSELRRILLEYKKEEFLRCLSEKILTYALGRGLEPYDKCAIEQVLARLRDKEYRFSSLILGVVNSPPFQMRRGEGDKLAAN